MLVNYRSNAINTPSIQTGSTALAQNLGRMGWTICNVGTNTLYVLLGTGASTTVYHIPCKAGTANDDGTGGSCGQETGIIYTGIITVAGTSPRYTVLEQAPEVL